MTIGLIIVLLKTPPCLKKVHTLYICKETSTKLFEYGQWLFDFNQGK